MKRAWLQVLSVLAVLVLVSAAASAEVLGDWGIEGAEELSDELLESVRGGDGTLDERTILQTENGTIYIYHDREIAIDNGSFANAQGFFVVIQVAGDQNTISVTNYITINIYITEGEASPASFLTADIW